MKDILQVIGNVGPFLTAVGLFLTFWALKASHRWKRRLYATNIVAEWNEKTSDHRKAIETIRPGLVDVDPSSKEVVQLTKVDAVSIYSSRSGTAEWELRFHLIELLNYFESISVAYRNRVGDAQIIEESVKAVFVRWHGILRDFIVVVEERRGYEPWEPFVSVVTSWERPLRKMRQASDAVS